MSPRIPLRPQQDSAPTGAGYTNRDESISAGLADYKGRGSSASTISGPVVNNDLVGLATTSLAVGDYNELSGGTKRATYSYVKAAQRSAAADSKPTTVWLRAEYTGAKALASSSAPRYCTYLALGCH